MLGRASSHNCSCASFESFLALQIFLGSHVHVLLVSNEQEECRNKTSPITSKAKKIVEGINGKQKNITLGE